MSQPAFAAEVEAFNSTLQAVESRVAGGEVPQDAVAEFKSSVDDLRLRLWSVLSAGSANDFRTFQERFRLRRAKEICRGLEEELESGVLSPRHEERGPLRVAAETLARRIQAMERPASLR